MGKGKKLDPPWTPFQTMTTLTSADGTKRILPTAGFDAAFRNSRYLVLLRKVMFPEPFGPGIHLSIKRHDKNTIHDWRDFQRIKNEILGPEMEAIELYPANSRLVDAANQYHLWCFPELPMNFGFDIRDVTGDKDTQYTAKQRPFEPDMLESFGGPSVEAAKIQKYRK